jgi:hypothetical protein
MMTTTCGVPTRGGHGATCELAEGHKGSHSSCTFWCEGCGQEMRGRPTASVADGAEWEASRIHFCFLCANGLRR